MYTPIMTCDVLHLHCTTVLTCSWKGWRLAVYAICSNRWPLTHSPSFPTRVCVCVPYVCACMCMCTGVYNVWCVCVRVCEPLASHLQAATLGKEDLIWVEILLVVLSDRASHTYTLVPHLSTISVTVLMCTYSGQTHCRIGRPVSYLSS